MLLNRLSKKKTFFIVTGAVNEKNGANGSMLDVVFALKKNYNINIITIGRPPLIGLIESLLHNKLFSYSISFLPIYQFILGKPNGIFFVANITKKQILYFKNKYPHAKLLIFQTGDIKSDATELSKINLIDYILFQSPGQLNDFIKVYTEYKNKALLLRPTIKENKFFNYNNQQYSIDLLKNNKQIIFTIIGSIQDRKNQLYAIKICKILYEEYNINLKLYVVGPFVDNEYKKVVLNFVKNNNLEGIVIFTGFQKKYTKFLSNAHIILSCSKEEGLSTIIRESLYLGKIIIASNISGNIGTLNKDNSILFELQKDIEIVVNYIYLTLSNSKKSLSIIQEATNTYQRYHNIKQYQKNLEFIICNRIK